MKELIIKIGATLGRINLLLVSICFVLWLQIYVRASCFSQFYSIDYGSKLLSFLDLVMILTMGISGLLALVCGILFLFMQALIKTVVWSLANETPCDHDSFTNKSLNINCSLLGWIGLISIFPSSILYFYNSEGVLFLGCISCLCCIGYLLLKLKGYLVLYAARHPQANDFFHYLKYLFYALSFVFQVLIFIIFIVFI